MKISLWALVVTVVATLVLLRVMDWRFQTQAAEFPIESCVEVNLVRGEIGYHQESRCVLVVKAFKAGRQSAKALKPIE